MFAMLLFARTKVINSIAALVNLGAFFSALAQLLHVEFYSQTSETRLPWKGHIVRRAEMSLKSIWGVLTCA